MSAARRSAAWWRDWRPRMAEAPLMTRDQFRIGATFYCGSAAWVCTDVGSRVVVAVESERLRDHPTGPPYDPAEMVFDEYDQEGCTLGPVDDAGELPRGRS